MKIVSLSLRTLQVFVFLIGIAWLSNSIKLSGSYIVTQVVARTSGTRASGKIELISPNPEMKSIANNYIALVSFANSGGRSMTQQFRYAEPKEQGQDPVTVYYLRSNPQVAALKDDAGYFYGTLCVFIGIGGFLIAVFLVITLCRRWATKKIRGSTTAA